MASVLSAACAGHRGARLAEANANQAWIVVSVPADGNSGEVAATTDAARALIADADAAVEQ
jgi:hypothetical protein